MHTSVEQNKLTQGHSQHRPFVLRKISVMTAFIFALAYSFWGTSFWQSCVAYCVLVTILDLALSVVLPVRPSALADPHLLQLLQHVTPQQLDAYCHMRRLIRCASLGMSLLVGCLLWLADVSFVAQAFCGTYMLSTLSGIAWVRLLKTPRPKVFVRDDRLLLYNAQTPQPGTISPEEWALNKATGYPILGPVDF